MNQQRRKSSIKWTLSDIVDLEYFLEQDQAQGEEVLKKRDRQFYLDKIRWDLDESASHDLVPPGDGSLARQAILKWLELRRNSEKEHKQEPLLPGALYKETATFLTWLFLFGGLFFGITVVASFFSYAGARPLNISYYLTLSLLGQLILLGVSVAGLMFARTGGVSAPMPLLQRFLALCMHKTMETLKQKSQAHISRDHQYAMAGALGLIRAKHRIYGSLFFWPLFILAQVFALGFNGGVIGMTLARVFFSDTAFGWQSTLQVGPELVHGLVSVVALPWSWLFPQGIACPTLAQIAGSRMILKDGIYHLTTGDLISWWPFLCLCVLFYGLLPRLVLMGGGQWMKNRCLGSLAFNHASCQRLVARMTTPVVSIDGSLSAASFSGASPSSLSLHPGGKEDPVPETLAPISGKNDAEFLSGRISEKREKTFIFSDSDAPARTDIEIFPQADKTDKKNKIGIPFHGEHGPPSGPDPLLGSRRALVLVSDDLEEMLDTEALSQQVLMQCGTTIVKQMPVGVDSQKELEMIKSICSPSYALADKNLQTSLKKIKKVTITERPESNTQGATSEISSPKISPQKPAPDTPNPTSTQNTAPKTRHPISEIQYPAPVMGPISSIVWLHEAWQPPIKETLFFLKGLRRVAGDGMDIIVGLVGKPSVNTLFTPPSDMDLSVWQKKLDALGDPWLRMVSMEKKS